MYLVPKIEPTTVAKSLSARVDEMLGQAPRKHAADLVRPARAHAYDDELSNSVTTNGQTGSRHQSSAEDSRPILSEFSMRKLAQRRVGAYPDTAPGTRLGWTTENDRWKTIKGCESNKHIALNCASNDLSWND
ncbi:MAG: hypothetical protein IPP88_24280 [Betaproteobacteria bacterium]|nr:hypothetical protein [Betaproteobacteria bacterium]